MKRGVYAARSPGGVPAFPAPCGAGLIEAGRRRRAGAEDRGPFRPLAGPASLKHKALQGLYKADGDFPAPCGAGLIEAKPQPPRGCGRAAGEVAPIPWTG